MRWLAALLLILAACSPAVEPVPEAIVEATRHPWRVVLVAGDRDTRAFDNATERMARWLNEAAGVRRSAIIRLSSAPMTVMWNRIPSATVQHLAEAMVASRPDPGSACLVFVTSHGLPNAGVALTWSNEILSPMALDRLLQAGCGDAPTVAIVSACFSGNFAAEPMTRDNRVILAASRPDRPSFGCGAGDTFTFFDQCLLDTLRPNVSWRDTFETVRTCVAQREAKGRFRPSGPRAFFGARVADLTTPGG